MFPQVRERLAWNYAQSRRADFVDRLVDEVYRKGVLLLRWHVAGDLYSPAYGRKLLAIMERSPHCRFWLYTRSWRVPTIAPVVAAMAGLDNARVWLSVDAETGTPPAIPAGVRVARMVTADGEGAEEADLVFLVPALRRGPIPLSVLATVCPAETPDGRDRGTTCATCRVCWT